MKPKVIEADQETNIVAHEATPAALLQMAVSKDLDITKLEKLMELQERYQANQARVAFLDAMSEFQSKVPVLEKTKKVAFGTTRYSYAPLGEIAQTIRNTMHECGLSHRWEMSDTDTQLVCTCIISHKDGHSEKTTMSAGKDASGGKNEIQQRGSTITYLQRYTLIAALGISTADEDVDGRNEKQTDAPVQNGHTVKAESQTQQPQDDKKWLNLWSDKSHKDFTKEGMNTIQKVASGAVTIAQVEKHYKLSKEVRAYLESQVPAEQPAEFFKDNEETPF